MTRAVTPKAVYNREGFEMLRSKGEERLCECESGVDDKVKGYNGDSGLLVKPLKIVLRPYLNRSWFGEREMGSRTIEGPMIKLVVGKVGVEGSKLSIRPPVLLGSKSVDEVGRTGGERTLRKFRGDY